MCKKAFYHESLGIEDLNDKNVNYLNLKLWKAIKRKKNVKGGIWILLLISLILTLSLWHQKMKSLTGKSKVEG